LRQKSIDRAELRACTATKIAKIRSIDTVSPIRNQQGQGGKSLHEILASAWTRKSLQKFLQYKSRGDYRLAARERAS
jgi:hypothetical protein